MFCNIWAWLNASNNAGAVQAVAAFLSFLAMVYLGYNQYKLSKQQTRLAEEQKEMTRRQINLALYEKRYKIYNQVLQFTSAVRLIHVPNRDDILDNGLYISPNCAEKLAESVSTFYSASWERQFLLSDEINNYIDGLVENAGQYHKSLMTPITTEWRDWEKYVDQNYAAHEKFSFNEKEIYEKFAAVLDFKKI